MRDVPHSGLLRLLKAELRRPVTFSWGFGLFGSFCICLDGIVPVLLICDIGNLHLLGYQGKAQKLSTQRFISQELLQLLPRSEYSSRLIILVLNLSPLCTVDGGDLALRYLALSGPPVAGACSTFKRRVYCQ